ncbi:MAG: protein kinase domain-containing protein [Gemmatimonadaceae bacterium]
MPDSLDRLKSAIADHYQIERELGHGAMATVYLARDIKLHREVAIKVLLPELGFVLGPERFRREIELATKMSHPHILPIYDSGEAEGELYYVMPYIAGESLRARLLRERQLPLDEALRIAAEVASALDHSHRHGIIHRDIKPENILLEDGQALVADFGIARAVSAVGEGKLTSTGVSLGTPAYMSPEQGMADPNLDGRTDIYSLGCVLYEMLAGSPPFTGRTTQALIARHSLDAVPSLSIVRQTIPEEVEDVVMCALAKVPADRFSTAGEFADALNACRQGGTVSIRRTRGGTRARAKPKKWGVIALAVALGIVAVTGAAWAGKAFIWDARRNGVTGGGAGGLMPQRIAVLYFSDLSPGNRLGYLADGLTESLIDRLSDIPVLDVVSRDGVRVFRGKDVSPDSVGRALGVGSVLRGSVDSDAGRIRVTVRLVDAGSNVDIDRKSFAIDTTQMASAQSALAGQVVDFLRQRLGDEVRLRADRTATTSSQAWTLVERANKLRKDADSLGAAGARDAALSTLSQADSTLAAAGTFDDRWAKIPTLRAAVMYARARQLAVAPAALIAAVDTGVARADEALKLQPNSADALQVRGDLQFFRYARRVDTDQRASNRLLSGAEADLTHAVDLDKDQADAWATLSELYYTKPDIQAANIAALNAYHADAYLSSARRILIRLFGTSYDLEQYPEALKWCNEGRRRYPTDAFINSCRLWMYTTRLARPDVDSAWIYKKQYVALAPGDKRATAEKMGDILVAGALARAGLPDSARHVLVRARATPEQDPERELEGYEAVMRVILGDQDEAVRLIADYLTVHPEHRKGFATRVSPWWRDLQSNPKFKQLLAGAR